MKKKISLLPHQQKAIEATAQFNKVAYYHDMGLGKTFTGSEKLMSFSTNKKLIVCQKSKVKDWVLHMMEYYSTPVYRITVKDEFEAFLQCDSGIGVINYDILFRRPELLQLRNYSLLLDESSLIQNDKAKRTKTVLKMQPDDIILLSGTPVGGKYENLYSQLRLLGVQMNKSQYWNKFICWHMENYGGYPVRVVHGYKNIDQLIDLLHQHGADFLKTEDVLELPEQNFICSETMPPACYRKLMKTGIITIGDQELIADNPLKKLLYARMCCSVYNDNRIQQFIDLLASTTQRIVVFYNFTAELNQLINSCDRPYSVINGTEKDLTNFTDNDNGVVFVQYQSGAMGLNLQLASILVYYSLPLSSELYEQSKKRIHRIGQNKKCMYYILTCSDSVEERILATLEKRKDYTDKLFEKDFLC